MNGENQHPESIERVAPTGEHRERLGRLDRQVQRAREAEMRDVAVNVLGVDPEDVARALRGVLTEQDER
jgi:hypothetical protein